MAAKKAVQTKSPTVSLERKMTRRALSNIRELVLDTKPEAAEHWSGVLVKHGVLQPGLYFTR